MKRSIKHQRFIMKKTVEILDRLVELKRLDVESKRMLTSRPQEKLTEAFRKNVCPIPDEFENLGNIFNPQKNSETFEAIKKDLINVNNQA